MDHEEAFDCMLAGMVECVKEYPLSRILGDSEHEALRLPYFIWKQEALSGKTRPIHPFTAAMQYKEWQQRLELFAHIHEVPKPLISLWDEVMLLREQDLFEHFVLERPWDPELYMELRMLRNGQRQPEPISLVSGPEYPTMEEAHAMAKYLRPGALRSITACFPLADTPWLDLLVNQDCEMPPEVPQWVDSTTQTMLRFRERTPTVMEILDLDKFPSNNRDLPDSQVFEYLALKCRQAADAVHWSQAVCRAIAQRYSLKSEDAVLDYLETKISAGKYMWEDMVEMINSPIEITPNPNGEFRTPIFGEIACDPLHVYATPTNVVVEGSSGAAANAAAGSSTDAMMVADESASEGGVASPTLQSDTEGAQATNKCCPLSPPPRGGDPGDRSPTEGDESMGPTSPKCTGGDGPAEG
eukprot:GHVU01061944.1.p1 GENE.GHVU01061944.1~~GHVU01061944.1.p1  ORF type:complete len:439 (+),score=48.01 GHVU01061944.1:79-1317(+)